MKQHKTNNTLVRSQKRQRERKRRWSSTNEYDDEDDDDDDKDDDVKVDDWQRRYFELTSLLALYFEIK